MGRWTNVALIVVLQYDRLFNDLDLARFVWLGFFVYIDSLLILRFNRLIFSECWLWISYCLRWLFAIRTGISLRTYSWSVECIHRLCFVYRSRSLMDHGGLLRRSVIVKQLAEEIGIRFSVRLPAFVVIRRLLASVRILVGLNRLPVIVLIIVLVYRIILAVSSFTIIPSLSLLVHTRRWCAHLIPFLGEILLSTFFFTLFCQPHRFCRSYFGGRSFPPRRGRAAVLRHFRPVLLRPRFGGATALLC